MKRQSEHLRQRHHEHSLLEQHQVFLRTFGRIDPIALGTALAMMFSLIFAALTLLAVLQDADDLKQKFDLLENYCPGFNMNFPQNLLSIPYGAIIGFLMGYCFATVRNVATRFVLHLVELDNFTAAIEHTPDD